MNREILFRGKTGDEWVYGDLSRLKNAITITKRNFIYPYIVMPETVGQYTGLNDKNNVKIFDGDIVTVENPNISDDEYGIVKFDNDGAMFIVEFDTFTVDFGNNIDGNRCEIIGNIFDNSELLKGEENE